MGVTLLVYLTGGQAASGTRRCSCGWSPCASSNRRWARRRASHKPNPKAPAGTSETATSASGPGSGERVDLTNPFSILRNAAHALPTAENAQADDANPPGDLSGPMSILILLTVLSVAPSLLVLTTSFTRIVVVLSLLRQAIGTQSLPPSQVIVGLAMFMTLLVMAPTFEAVRRDAINPLQENQISELEAWSRAKQPFRDFMFNQIEYAGNWADVYMVLNYQGVDTSDPTRLTRADVDMLTLIPAYVLSELKVAFLMAFRLYLPFLIIDMVVASVLISMGMMMLPPVLVSLPFKLLLFVLVDGWQLVAGSLLNSFVTGPGAGGIPGVPGIPGVTS